jgi:hypothetical protein
MRELNRASSSSNEQAVIFGQTYLGSGEKTGEEEGGNELVEASV